MSDSQLKATLTADASQFSVEMAKAVKANQDFMTAERLKAEVVRAQERSVQEAQTAAAATGEAVTSQTVSQINRQVKSLVEQAQRVEYGTTAIRAMRAEQLGIAASTQQFRDAIAQSATAAEGLGHGSAAARRELLVLAHEASQGSWKQFAGSFLVLGERMDFLAYLTNPVALGLAAVAAASYVTYSAIHGASEEFTKFNQSLSLTNNWANLTNDTAATLAKTISGDVGTSFEAARAAVDATAASGKVLGIDMQTVTELALVMAKSTGDSFDKALDSVLKQQDGVSKAADDWQSAHHDMDAATLEHIKALDKAGEHTTALRILYDQELKTMKSGTDTQVGAMTALWNGFLDKWSATKRAIAGTSTPEDQRAALVSQLNDTAPDGANPLGANSDSIKKQIAAIDAQTASQKQATEAANAKADAVQRLTEFDNRETKILEQNATNEQKRTKAVNEATAAYAKRVELAKTAGTYTPALDAKFASQRDVEISDAQNKFKDEKPKREKAYTDDAATRMLQAAGETNAALAAQLSTHEKIGAEQEKEIKFEQQIADLKTKKTLTADQKSLLAHQAEIDAALKQNAELEKQVASQEALNKLKAAAASIDADIASYQQSQAEQYDRQLSALGMGSDAQKQAEAVKSIYAKYQQEQEKLNKAARDTGMDNSVYTGETAKIQADLQTSLKAYADYYAEIKGKQADWVNGVTAGWADYVSEADNKMKQTEHLFSDVTGGMEDAWVNFAQTGKLSFTSLANSVIADLARMSAKAAISGFFSSAISAASSYFGGSSGAATTVANALPGDSLDNLLSLTGNYAGAHAAGGVLSGAGTGTSDSLLIRASNGESILTADTTKRLGGSAVIDALNSGKSLNELSRFATGGVIGSAVSSVAPAALRDAGLQVNVPVTIEGSSGSASSLQNSAELGKKITSAVRAVIATETKQGGVLWKMRNGVAG